MQAEQIVTGIAVNAEAYHANPGQFFGYIEKATKTQINFVWMRAEKPSELTITCRGVVASRTKMDGQVWYGYTLDPFGENVPYAEKRRAAEMLLVKHGIQKRQG